MTAAVAQYQPAKRHPFIESALEKAQQWIYRPESLPSLQWSPVQGSLQERKRAMRIDHRQNVARVLRYLIEHMDLTTMIVGVNRSNPRSPVFYGFKLENMAERLHMDVRTAERCIRTLRDAGIVETKRRTETKLNADGSKRFIGHTAVRRLTQNFFAAVGLVRWLKRVRAWASRALANKASPMSATAREQAAANTRMALGISYEVAARKQYQNRKKSRR